MDGPVGGAGPVSSLRLVQVGPVDWRSWRTLRRRALAEDPAAFGSTLAEWSGAGDAEERWRARLAEVALNLIVYDAEAPVGMASGHLERPGRVEVISMWVDPGTRRRGVARLLLDAVRAWGERQHPGADLVLAVRRDNSHAIAAYQATGFVVVGGSAEDPREVLMRWVGPASVPGRSPGQG